MTTMTTPASLHKRSVSVDDVLREFREVYADAVNEWDSPEEWNSLATRRCLTWKAARRIPLTDASRCYAQIGDGYNEFRPHMIPHLWAMFHNDGIEVTAAREYSVAAYLHVPDETGLRQCVEAFVNDHFDADVVAWVDDETLRIWWD